MRRAPTIAARQPVFTNEASHADQNSCAEVGKKKNGKHSRPRVAAPPKRRSTSRTWRDGDRRPHLRTSALEQLETREMLTNWYVAPDGSPTNNGTINSPWDIASALDNTTQVKPGDTLLLRGGTYYAPDRSPGIKGFGINLQGSTAAPIVVMPYNSEHVVIDGGLYTADQYDPSNIVIEGLEILVSENLTQTRTSTYTGSEPPPDLLRPWGGIDLVKGENISIINNDIHDNMQGIGLWAGVTGAVIYGNVIDDNGWNGPDRGHGHGIYTQNAGPTTDYIENNIVFGNYGLPLQAYGSSLAQVNNFDIEENFFAGNEMALIGSQATLGFNDIVLNNNVVYGVNLKLGYTTPGNNAVVEGNTIISGELQLMDGSTNVTAQNNIWWTGGQHAPDNNTAPVPTTPFVFVEPNQYDRNRANVAIIDFQPDIQMQVSVGNFLHAGDTYEVMDPSTLFGTPVASGTYDGSGTISVPLSGNMSTIYQQYAAQYQTYVILKLPAPTATTFSVTGFPASKQAGTPGAITLTALNADGTIDTGYTGTVLFSSSDRQAALPAAYTFTASDAGVHTFSATLDTAGTQSITATAPTTGTVTGSETDITVMPSAASQLVVKAPGNSTAGNAFNVTVTALDPYNNLATSYSGTVTFTSSDGHAIVPSNYSFTPSDAGVHTFNATLDTAGTQSITATDAATGTITASETGVTVAPAAANQLVVNAPTVSLAGSAFAVTVSALDPYYNLATGYSGTVKFASSDGQAIVPANYTFTASDAAVHTFSRSVTLKTAGKQTVTAMDTTFSSVTGGTTIAVNAAAASTIIVSQFPKSITAGVGGSFTVTLKDTYGNVATGYTGTVDFTSTDAQAFLPLNYTFTSADAGKHAFSAMLKTAGTQSIAAADTAIASLYGTDSAITVNPAAASKLVISAPISVMRGMPFSLTITVEDAYGNIVTGYTSTIQFTSSDNRAKLPTNYTFTAGDNGVHTFTGLVLKAKGNQTIAATDTHISSIKGKTAVNVV